MASNLISVSVSPFAFLRPRYTRVKLSPAPKSLPEGRQTYQEVCKRVGHENITYPFDVIFDSLFHVHG